MKNALTLSLTIWCLVAFGAPDITVRFFTDKPNSVPVGSDFMLFQRNQNFVNSSVAQMKQDWFNNPVFSGNGGIQGVWTAVAFVGDGSQLTGINATATNLTYITNSILYSTNIYSTNITVINLTSVTNVLLAVTNSYTITTNIVIEQPGGFQNLNLTPSSLMASDALDNEVSVVNGSGALTNNGSGGFGWYKHFLPDLNGNGTNMNFYGVTTFSELDVTSGYFTNLFTFLTNAPYLATDGDGKVIATTTPSLTSATNEVTRQINSSTNIYASLGTAISDLSLGTNLTYKYITNNSGSTTLNWGTAYRTNLAANVTIALQSVSTAANAPFYQTIVYWVTNSSGSDFKVTSPSGVIGPVGSGTPSALYCTNKTLTRILFEHYGPSDITVSKTDYGN